MHDDDSTVTLEEATVTTELGDPNPDLVHVEQVRALGVLVRFERVTWHRQLGYTPKALIGQAGRAMNRVHHQSVSGVLVDTPHGQYIAQDGTYSVILGSVESLDPVSL